MSSLSYWERLQYLDLYSLERRRERYIIIYVWRMLQGHVPNIGITSADHGRRGILCDIPKLTSRNRTQTLRDNSFSVKGPVLFNSVPNEIRALTGCKPEFFKNRLDKWLKTVPDQPRIPGYQAYCQSETNSITNMSRIANI